MSGWSGIDFGRFNPADVVKKEETNAIHSLVEHLTGGNRTWTIKELAQWGGIGGAGPRRSRNISHEDDGTLGRNRPGRTPYRYRAGHGDQ